MHLIHWLRHFIHFWEMMKKKGHHKLKCSPIRVHVRMRMHAVFDGTSSFVACRMLLIFAYTMRWKWSREKPMEQTSDLFFTPFQQSPVDCELTYPLMNSANVYYTFLHMRSLDRTQRGGGGVRAQANVHSHPINMRCLYADMIFIWYIHPNDWRDDDDKGEDRSCDLYWMKWNTDDEIWIKK